MEMNKMAVGETMYPQKAEHISPLLVGEKTPMAMLMNQNGKMVDLNKMIADVTSTDHRLRIKMWIEKKWGKLDVLVNNAGINIRKPSNKYEEREYRSVFEMNVLAPFELSRMFYSSLLDGAGSAVINIASVAGILDARTGAPYGM